MDKRVESCMRKNQAVTEAGTLLRKMLLHQGEHWGDS